MGGELLDFTSSAYLGFRPRAVALSQVTTARPAALGVSSAVLAAERALAGWTDFPRAWLAPSTLHLLIDLFLACRQRRLRLVLERGAYPLLLEPARAVAEGTGVSWFERGSVASLERALTAVPPGRAVVLAETLQARPPYLAPIADYARACREAGALLALEDSQATGLLGKPCPRSPFGCGGQGALARVGGPQRRVVLIASLAKAFGVPAAFAAGPREIIEDLFSAGLMALHASPASNQDAALVMDALRANELCGDVQRARLSRRIRLFRRLCRRQSLPLSNCPLPLQRLTSLPAQRAYAMWRELRRGGIRALLLREARQQHLGLAFIVRADHRAVDLRQLARALTRSWARSRVSP